MWYLMLSQQKPIDRITNHLYLTGSKDDANFRYVVKFIDSSTTELIVRQDLFTLK